MRAMSQMRFHKPLVASVATDGLYRRAHPFSLINFCTEVEKSELPSWMKRPRNNESHSDEDEDFVLPTDKASWANVREYLEPKTRFRDSIPETDVEKISKVLNARSDSIGDIHRALEGCRVKVSEDLVEQILKRFNNDWASALGFFEWARSQNEYKHTAEAYDTMVDILGKMKQFEAMWYLIKEMKELGGLISLRTFSKVMRRYTGAEKWVDAVETFNRLEEFGVKIDTAAMNVLFDTLCKERRTEHAWDSFLDLKDRIPPSPHTFNVLIHGWCKAKKLEEAEWTMEEMRRHGFDPSVITYTILVEAYCLQRDFRKVEDLLEEMRRHGFDPSVITYTILVEAYCLQRDFRKVDDLLDEMQKRGCPPNVITYTIVMHALGKAKETQEAFRIYDRMKATGCTPDVAFYNSLIFILGKAGQLESAQDIFQEMAKNGFAPNVTTYNTLISVVCDHLQEKKALKIFHEMEEANCKPDLQTYNPLLKMCCKLKRMKILSYLVDDMLKKDCSPDLGTYTLLVHGLCKAGKLERACQFFEEMVEKKLIPKYITYILLLDELEGLHKNEEKKRIQELMMKAESMKQLGRRSRMQDET